MKIIIDPIAQHLKSNLLTFIWMLSIQLFNHSCCLSDNKTFLYRRQTDQNMDIRILKEETQSFLLNSHQILMPYCWSILIDIAAFLPFYLHKPYAMIAHIVLTSIVVGVSMLTAADQLLTFGLSSDDKHYFHKVLGFLIFMLFLAQMAMGIISRRIKNSDKVEFKWVYLLRKGHMYLGYCIILASKFQVMKILKTKHFGLWFNLVWNTASVSLFIYRKMTYQRVQNRPEVPLSDKSLQMRDLDHSEGSKELHLILGNRIYAGQKILETHPAGKEIIRSIKGRCVERYLYGMLPDDSSPLLSFHSHSTISLHLLGAPVSIISIKQPYTNLIKESEEASIQSIQNLPRNSRLLIVYVNLKTVDVINFAGYSDIKQLGRHYSMTMDGMTRLYSAVNFLTIKNRMFLAKVFQIQRISQGIVMVRQSHAKSNKNLLVQEMLESDDSQQKQHCIPLLIKSYEKGRFTPKLFSGVNRSVVLSHSKGMGLELDKVKKGTIVMIGGGTGINPYLDFIDLLFKGLITDTRPELVQEIMLNDSVLRDKPFDRLRVIFMIAVATLSDIPDLTLRQLKELTKAGRVEVRVRVRDRGQLPLSFMRVQQTFEVTLVQKLLKNVQIQRIFICGPPRMNSAISISLDKINYTQYKLL